MVWIAEQIRALSLIVVTVLTTMAAAAGSAPTVATATTTCAPFAAAPVAGGRYIVQQNEWNSHERQCIRVNGTSWTIMAADFHTATNGPPATYPSIYTGCHWGTCTASRGLPIRIRNLTSARSSWSTTLVPTGAYDVAYDLWTNTTRAMEGQPDGSEIMIWLSSRGAVQPGGSRVAAVRMAGAMWAGMDHADERVELRRVQAGPRNGVGAHAEHRRVREGQRASRFDEGGLVPDRGRGRVRDLERRRWAGDEILFVLGLVGLAHHLVRGPVSANRKPCPTHPNSPNITSDAPMISTFR